MGFGNHINADSSERFVKNDSFQLVDATVDSVHLAMKSGQLTCVELVTSYLNRIKQYNLSLSHGAPINAFTALNPNVLSEAVALDKYYKLNKSFKGPMHCIPVIVKDNINTVYTPSTAGSLSMLGSQPVTNAFLVNKILSAGGIIIGKGAMDEFASGMSGISSRSGRVGNAYDSNQNPGGSSSGVGAAVSANFAMVGIGTDNSGSVRIPAAFNGIYGIRPSFGLVSQNGIFPRGNTDGVAGVIARNIKDLSITLSVISNSQDPNDYKTHHYNNRPYSYSSYLTKNAFKGKKIGIITSVDGEKTFDANNKEAMAIFETTFSKLSELGATLVRVKLPKFDSNRDDNMAGDIQDINSYLSSFPSTRKSYKDVCLSDRTRIFGSMDDCLKVMIKSRAATKDSKTYKQVFEKFSKNRAYIEKIMQENNLSAFIMPLNADGGPSYDISKVNTWKNPVSANTGLPAITIISGYTNSTPKMPVGMEFIGGMYQEGEIISLAYSYEKSSPKRLLPIMPKIIKSKSLINMSIPEMNNLFTLIGYNAYNKFLKNSLKKQMITPNEFAISVKDTINKNLS